MKKNNLLICIGFIICTAFIKPMLPPTDYRDSYIGNYFCSSRCQIIDIRQNDRSNNIDTITIYIRKDVLDSILDIRIRRTTFKVKVRNGVMSSYPNGHWSGKFFATDSIGFYTSISHASNCTYKGRKQ